MIEPLSLLSNVGGSMTAAVTFSNVVLGLKNCPEEAKTCFSLVKLVHADIEYAVSLRTKHRVILQQRPDDAKRIDSILQSASKTLVSVSSVVERLNPDAHGGKIPYRKRLRWFLGDSASFALRTRDLQAQHAAVQGEIHWLRMIELVAPLHSVAETKTSFDNFDLWKRDRPDEDEGDENADSNRSDRDKGFLSPNPAISSFLHRVPSAQTLVGSASEASQHQYRGDVNQWDRTTFDLNGEYSGEEAYVELLGSSTFGENFFSGTSSSTSHEQDDDIGLFFRAWREDQVERRDAIVELS